MARTEDEPVQLNTVAWGADVSPEEASDLLLDGDLPTRFARASDEESGEEHNEEVSSGLSELASDDELLGILDDVVEEEANQWFSNK